MPMQLISLRGKNFSLQKRNKILSGYLCERDLYWWKSYPERIRETQTRKGKNGRLKERDKKDNKRQSRGRGKEHPVRSKGAKHVYCLCVAAFCHVSGNSGIGTLWFFLFDTRSCILWKIISCVNGKLVLRGIFPLHFGFFSPPTFTTLLPVLYQATS